MDIKLVIFDLDGTIADSFEAAIETFSELARPNEFEKIGSDEMERLRSLSSEEIMKYFKVPRWRLPFFVRKAQKRLSGKMSSIKPFGNISEVLLDIKNKNITMGLLTSNSRDNAKYFLRLNNLEYFDFIDAGSGFFGKAKKIKKILKKTGIDPEKAAYVGDETRDIEAAREAGIYSISVSWGFNSLPTLEKFHPDSLIDKPADILKVLQI